MRKSLSKFIDNFLTTNQMKMIMGGYADCTVNCPDGATLNCNQGSNCGQSSSCNHNGQTVSCCWYTTAGGSEKKLYCDS